MNDTTKPEPPAPSTTPMQPERGVPAPATPDHRETKPPPFPPARETTREGGRRSTHREAGR